MNKLLSIFFTLTLLSSGMFYPSLRANTKIEVRSAAFFHTSSKFRTVYGDVGPCFSVEASRALPIFNCFCAPYEAWVNFDWFAKEKKQKDCCCKSKVQIQNISLGLKYVYSRCERFDIYIGLGASGSEITLHNKSFCESERVCKRIIGGIIKIGARQYLSHCIFSDIFADYLYQPVRYQRRVDIGGLKVGLGIGVNF